MITDYNKAKEELLANFNLDCQQFFVKKGYILENAYCELLNDNLENAKKLFLLIQDEDIRAKWALFMVSMIENNIKEYPSYFMLRNFLEIDLNILIKHFKGDYVEKIIRYSDYMFTINPEIYKFVGRVLYNNNLEEQAMFFLNRAKSYFYHDPELHYELAYIHYKKNDLTTANKYIESCLRVLPQYYPAKALKQKLMK